MVAALEGAQLRACNNYIVRESFYTRGAGSILEVHSRSSRKEKVINIHDIRGSNNTIKHARKNTMNVSVSSSFPSC